MTEGVAETENVEVKGPDFGHLGKGSVQLLKRQADYRGNLSAFVPPTLDIPFFVSGPWSRLQAGLDENAGGAFRVILSYLGIKWSGSLESVAESDPELDKLTREFVETASAMKTLPAEDAAALQTLQQKLGIKARQ